jgi:HEAT repeat protein
LEERIGLSLVAQNAVDEDPSSLDFLVDQILPSLETDDAARRGDTADLLGAIGHENARSALEKLLSDNHEDVVEAAEDALDCINERTKDTGGSV